MTTKLSNTSLSAVTDYVAAQLGLDFRQRWHDLERGIRAVVQEQNYDETEDYLKKLLSDCPRSRELELLARYLTVGETYFFREKRALEILERRILPELAQMRTSLSIWSAGCSTGEEPYSIAMMLDRMRASLGNANIKIFGTDINPHALKKATDGIYGEWSFRGVPQWAKTSYFRETSDGQWSIQPAIKARVKFSRVNLMKDFDLPRLMGTNTVDVIFCRNVLMYFTPEAMHKVAHRFYEALAPNGWLIVSLVEAPRDFPEFVTVNFDGVTLYRKLAVPLKFVAPDKITNDEKSTVHTLEPISTDVRSSISVHEAVAEVADETDLDRKQAKASIRESSFQESASQEKEQEPETLLLFARACANQRKLVEALAWCEKVIAADKMAAVAHYLKAAILEEQGLLQEACSSLRQVVYAEPRFVMGHFSLGNLALRQGKRKESHKHFENVRLLLAQHRPEDIVPESDGLSVGMLREMLVSKDAHKFRQISQTVSKQVVTR